MSHKVPAKAFAVLYTWHGSPAKAIFLTKDRALDYITKHSLGDALLKPMYFEEDFDGTDGCIVKASDVALASADNDGNSENVTVCPAPTLLLSV